tara:strand:- start:150 stop:383 length:234 start_codon:yes stop_codon:yes gene_type:complete
MDLNKLITKRINEYALNGDANLLDQYGFLITMIAKEYAAQQLILSGVIVSDFCECDGVQDLHAMTGECRKCGKECDY